MERTEEERKTSSETRLRPTNDSRQKKRRSWSADHCAEQQTSPQDRNKSLLVWVIRNGKQGMVEREKQTWIITSPRQTTLYRKKNELHGGPSTSHTSNHTVEHKYSEMSPQDGAKSPSVRRGTDRVAGSFMFMLYRMEGGRKNNNGGSSRLH